MTKNGRINVEVEGELTIHGVTQKVKTGAVLEVQSGKLMASAEFNVAVADYKIAIPSLVKDKIAKNVKISVDAGLEPLKQ